MHSSLLNKVILLSFTLLLLLIALPSNGQNKTTTLLKYGTSGYFESKVIKDENIDSGERSYYMYLTYKNRKYQQITDLAFIYFHNQESLDAFKKDIDLILETLAEKSNLRLTRENYDLWIPEGSKKIWIADEEDKYFILTRKLLQSYRDWLDLIIFPKE
ncbi:MAG: hypothetical protein HQ500_02495 [Flavobacteriales bacterium]|nr:hypothetical protein [Flavobacteriales bacterium]